MTKNRFLLLVSALLLAGVLAGCGQAAAPAPTAAPVNDPRADALTAYREILEAAPALEGEHGELMDASFNYEQNREKFGNHYDLFALSDLNQDGVPELIAQTVVNFRWTPVFVYTYSDGSTILLKTSPEIPGIGTFEQNSSANGAYTLYFCEENHIHSQWRGETPEGEMVEEEACALEGTNLVLKACTVGENEKTVYFSDIAKENSAENREAMAK